MYRTDLRVVTFRNGSYLIVTLQNAHCFSMQAIQDMNNLKRLIRQAEMSHYALFRCCLFLQSCGNGDVLLQNARAEHSSLPEACGIINVLEEHAQGTLN